jgi:hypothetical protein
MCLHLALPVGLLPQLLKLGRHPLHRWWRRCCCRCSRGRMLAMPRPCVLQSPATTPLGCWSRHWQRPWRRTPAAPRPKVSLPCIMTLGPAAVIQRVRRQLIRLHQLSCVFDALRWSCLQTLP